MNERERTGASVQEWRRAFAWVREKSQKNGGGAKQKAGGEKQKAEMGKQRGVRDD